MDELESYNPFETEPTEDDYALDDVTLLDDCGDPIGFETRPDETVFVEETPGPEFVDDDGILPDDVYDTLAEFASGTYSYWPGL